MIALRKTVAAFGAELVSLGVAQAPGYGELAIEVAAAGICGSDIHAYEWTAGYEFMTAVMPVTIGHEFSGVVQSVGEGVSGFRAGDRVTCWPTKTCGKCHACSAGRPQDCGHRSIIGLHCDGGFAERVTVPASNCRRIPDGLDLEIAALTEPLSIAVNALDVAEVAPGDCTVVLGPGPIGLGVAWVAANRGADVLLAGFNDAVRLSLAREMGIPHIADLAETSLADAVTEAFGQPADRVIEATGVAQSVADGLMVLRSSGILVAAGIHSSPLQLDLTRFVREKKQLRAAHDTTSKALEEAIRLLAENAETLSCLITHRRPLSQAVEAFELARSRQAVKVLLLPGALPSQFNGEEA
ncbi:zinc-dependent alcohol dehydrogenase [Sinorhizobium meliloti]|uniref:Sorbitol dehydrogenase n=1 Tax=Sinorhizobium meliloti (strain SM11) TaxID=707241 RepID=F7XD31_SINMM|nr:alcohol dehydrogenase catalytic domain-containing protein [Sinorhizobium meliloti]PST22651.1 sorbitol dehydrogenase [Mesorhizobium loti]AEH81510.1 sorbitol dehydrogenase [Sinorhizobium meliloti SM11]ARS67597.1 sorbitol dehydrogenase [Sinorhizobium meliloti RU11/001]ASP56763.1 sorbitol dehydrogenase [Sinorhizobium meliloti]ASP66667.1 sorbitol dehydrogenase [Sinorhizobium meliloti]